MEQKIRESYNDAILHEAMRRYGIPPGKIRLLDGFENILYSFRQGRNRRILRISHSLHRDVYAIRGEIDWLSYLAANSVPVAYPVPSLSGEMVEVLGEGDEYFSATSFVYAPGRPPSREDWQNGLLGKVGRLIGWMNALAKNYQPRDPVGRRPHQIDDIKGFERFLPAGEEGVAEKHRQMVAGLSQLPTDREVYGLVHQDVHGGNFFVRNGQITLFDFDDTLYGWFAYDVAMAFFYVLPHDCSSLEHKEFARRALSELLEGYRQENSLDSCWVREIPRFLKQREIDLYIAIHRSLDLNDLDPWCASFMKDRREKILNDVPYVDIDFG